MATIKNLTAGQKLYDIRKGSGVRAFLHGEYVGNTYTVIEVDPDGKFIIARAGGSLKDKKLVESQVKRLRVNPPKSKVK